MSFMDHGETAIPLQLSLQTCVVVLKSRNNSTPASRVAIVATAGAT
jgi:hypothetical protein